MRSPSSSPRSRRGRPGAAPGPVRLLAPGMPSPFAPGREVTFARVSGAGLAAAGLRDGDHVALARRSSAREGEVASVVGPDGTETLRALDPPPAGLDDAPPRDRRRGVRGVVVGVLRKLDA